MKTVIIRLRKYVYLYITCYKYPIFTITFFNGHILDISYYLLRDR
jgi:hypothetical protein